jgi:hypothetical protein
MPSKPSFEFVKQVPNLPILLIRECDWCGIQEVEAGPSNCCIWISSVLSPVDGVQLLLWVNYSIDMTGGNWQLATGKIADHCLLLRSRGSSIGPFLWAIM